MANTNTGEWWRKCLGVNVKTASSPLWRQEPGGQTQASGRVWTHVLAPHPSWDSGLWQEFCAVPGTGGCAEGKAGCRRKDRALPLCPSRHPLACKGGPRCPSPRASKSARTLLQGAGRSWGTRCTKICARATRGQAAVTRGKTNMGGGHVPFFRITPTSEYPGAGGREGRRTGASLSLGEQRIKYEWSPSSHPFPD